MWSFLAQLELKVSFQKMSIFGNLNPRFSALNHAKCLAFACYSRHWLNEAKSIRSAIDFENGM